MIRQASNLAQIFVVVAAGVVSSLLLFMMTDGLFQNRSLAVAVAVATLLAFFWRALTTGLLALGDRVLAMLRRLRP